MSVGWGQDCDEGFVWIDDPPLNEYNWDGYNCFYELDLNVLSEFIQLNSSLSGQHLDIGWQYWVNGRLEGLTLYALQLTSIPNNIGSLNNLTYLNLHFNQITNIPETIGELTQLTEIYLENNLFGTLPESIGNLTNLITLNINENQLISIPENIGNLTDLEKLLLYNNSLTSLPESICNIFSNLSQYDFSDNYICPPYPYCIENVGYQDTSECEGCCYEEFLANENCDGEGCFIPQCTENCEWEPIQCWGSTGSCWRVDENGVEIEGTSQPPSEGFPDCEEIDLGDINGDDSVDILDIVMLVNYIQSGDTSELDGADINNDGEVNILDIVALVNIILSN